MTYCGSSMPTEPRLVLQKERFFEASTNRSLLARLGEAEKQLTASKVYAQRLTGRILTLQADNQRLNQMIGCLQEGLFAFRRLETDLRQEIDRLRAELTVARLASGKAAKPGISGAEKTYKKLAAKYHPDRNPAAGEFMKDLNQFWQEVKLRY